jgi:diguanylate cyclase (GGDEF)-like protein
VRPGGPRLPIVANPSPPPPATPPRRDHRLVGTCAILAVLAIASGVAAVLLDEAVLALVAAALGVTAAAIGAFVERRRQRAEDALLEARSQARRLRRQVESLEAEAAEEHTIQGARALGGEPLPEGTDTSDWEIDPVSGLIRERHLPVVLQQVLASARRKVQPVTVVYWEVDGLADASPSACDDALTALGAVAWRSLRESDAIFRLGERAAVGVLVDTAEPGAVVVAERVRTSLRASPVGDALTVSAGIACYPTHAVDAMELVSRAGATLDAARAGGQAPDHVAVAHDETEPS